MTAGAIWSLIGAVDLAGNWSWTVWLLIPVVVLLAYVTARCLGSDGDPGRASVSRHGVSAYLDRRADEEVER